MVLNFPTKCNASNPLSIEILNINEHPWHMHDTMEIIYVIKGTLDCGISIYPSTLEAGDIAVVNTQTLHSYKGSDDNITIVCHLDLEHFNEIIPEISNTLIICNSAAAVEYDKHYGLLKEALSTVVSYYFELRTSAGDELMDSCVDFLSVMFNHFNFLRHEGVEIHSENVMKQKPLQAERVKRVMKYIYDNLDGHISLEDISAKEFVSKYYMSHLVSEFLNMPFREYVNMTRAVYAQDYLYGTDKSLGEVAASCGFSSAEAFRKAYLKHVGISPAEDRKRISGHTVNDMPFSDTDALSAASLDDIAALMGIKSYHPATGSNIADADYPVTSIPVNFAELSGNPFEKRTDTVWLEGRRHLLSFRILEAIDEFRYYKMFSKIFVDSRTLNNLYTTFGSWDFCGNLLHKLKSTGFTLVTDSYIKSFSDFSAQINGPEIITGKNEGFPSVYKTPSGSTYLFDDKNHKTKEFYIYYFMSKMMPQTLYTDGNCCATYSDDRLSILLYSKPDDGIRKYMFNLKHLSRNYICRTHKIGEHYQSEIDIYKSLGLETSADEELAKIIGVKTLPEVELSTIAGLPEYNLFLSLPPDTVTLIELT